MKGYYLIRGESKENGRHLYLVYDSHSGGYPCWIESDSMAERVSPRDLMQLIGKVQKAFKREDGEYYSPEIAKGSLEYVQIDFVNPKNLSEIDEDDIMWDSIESNLNEEQLAFVKRLAKGGENGK